MTCFFLAVSEGNRTSAGASYEVSHVTKKTKTRQRVNPYTLNQKTIYRVAENSPQPDPLRKEAVTLEYPREDTFLQSDEVMSPILLSMFLQESSTLLHPSSRMSTAPSKVC